ncbi:ABC transporter ATP-binding protein [Paenibacillus faecis]|uniref:ABC transporter ATP-binding protein n=1 Tax=Paenibacillus faecis TaxID=862114 RepID=A0A5D0CXC0_9BACL|nr:ABC transporter ATP-binding protein [Paenibacillus faecis]TYA14652.1 ABC transporter ATP-binding protein [Paenibacillus faecis]
MRKNILEVSHLRVWDEATGNVLVRDSSFQVRPGSCLSIVGESGSGKSVTCRAVMRLNKSGIRQSGDIRFDGVELGRLSEKEMRNIRGKQICMILQHGMSAFDPSRPIGVHVAETLARHYGWSKSEITAKAKSAMESVRLKDPIGVLHKYPHQLSGGMLQRIMIALALMLEPDLIIADEPTTALDTVSQFEVVEQLMALRERIGCAMLFVSHDLGVVGKLADDILVMKEGEIVERGSAEVLFSNARHAYTRELVSAKRVLHEHFTKVMGGVDLADR